MSLSLTPCQRNKGRLMHRTKPGLSLFNHLVGAGGQPGGRVRPSAFAALRLITSLAAPFSPRPPPARSVSRASNPHVVVDADALQHHELTWPAVQSMNMVRRLRRYRATVSGV